LLPSVRSVTYYLLARVLAREAADLLVDECDHTLHLIVKNLFQFLPTMVSSQRQRTLLSYLVIPIWESKTPARG
jgi:hypothetical protein